MDKETIIKKLPHPLVCIILIAVAIGAGIAYGCVNHARNEKQALVSNADVMVYKEATSDELKVLHTQDLEPTTTFPVNTESQERMPQSVRDYFSARYNFKGSYSINKERIIEALKPLVTPDFLVTVEKSFNESKKLEGTDREMKDYHCEVLNVYQNTSMKVKYAEPGTPNDFKIAKAGDRSTKSHAYYILDISECDHKDLSGKSVLTYTIDGDKHTEKCKYCNYKATVAHHGSDCECGYQSDTCIVHISDDAGLTSATVARNGQFELPDNGDRVQSSNTNPKTYYRVTGWLLSGDTSGKVYENGETVTVDRDMTFTSVQEDLYQVSFDGLDHGSIHADIKNNEGQQL